jgi:UDP-glucose 4-epimerase
MKTGEGAIARHGDVSRWKLEFPKLEDIVKTAWAWHKKHPAGYPD